MWPCRQRPASGTSRGKTAGRTGSVPVPGGSGPVRPMTSASRHDETKGGKLWHRIRHSMTSARPATLRHPMIWTCGPCMPVFCRMCAPAGSSLMPVAARGGTRWLSGRRASGWRPSMLRRRWPGRQRSCWGRRCRALLRRRGMAGAFRRYLGLCQPAACGPGGSARCLAAFAACPASRRRDVLQFQVRSGAAPQPGRSSLHGYGRGRCPGPAGCAARSFPAWICGQGRTTVRRSCGNAGSRSLSGASPLPIEAACLTA